MRRPPTFRRPITSTKTRGITLVELMIGVTITGVLAAGAVSSFREQMKVAQSVEALETLNQIKKAVSTSTESLAGSQDALDLSTTTFGKGNGNGNSGGGIDGNGNSGDSGNGSSSNSGNGNSGNSGNSGGTNHDGDGNNGHGDNENGCDPDNPGKSKHCDFYASSAHLCESAIPVPQQFAQVKGVAYNANPQEWNTTGWQCLNFAQSGNQHYQYGYDVGDGNLTDSDESYTAWARGDVDGDGRSSYFRMRGELIGDSVIHAPTVEIVDQNE